MKDKKKKQKTDYRGALKVIVRLIKDMKPIAWWLITAMVVTLLSVLLSMASPNLLGRLTDRVYNLVNEGIPLDWNAFFQEVGLLAVVYVGVAIMGLLTTYIMNYSVTRHFTCRIRTEMSKKIEKIPVKTVDTTPNGEIISRMTNDVSIMGGSVHDIFGVIINGVIRLVVISVIIFFENYLLALAVVVFVPISIILSGILASKSEKHFDEARKVNGEVYALCEENLTGFDTVKVFSLEEHQNKRYEQLITDDMQKVQKGYVVSGIVQPLVAFINNFAYVAICIIGGYLAINKVVSAGELVAFIMYTKLFSGPLESIASGMSMMQSTIASSKRVYEYLDGEQMQEFESSENLSNIKGEVVFDDVYFSYTPEKRLIEGFSLKVKAGQKVAIVGPTGGGKTTIVNLLMRFYDPQKGKIFVDGRDISTLPRTEVRKAFGMVLQDTVLFSGSVFSNVAYGKPTATYEEVENAVKKAHVDTFINSLPDGYQTIISEDSANVSGGQKQLLTIARAYLADRPILILDEATSNVDTRTELLIQQTMDSLMKGRTAFVIAHRLSTIENADVILVVDNGKIVEQGNHSELIKKRGLYYKIHSSQYQNA
ncbi:MAG: ABC transporter ATP-binding protein [Clostridia bacterium]|nr:ABC transporter ATP-binding protein [Clostridia bacterium]